MKRFLALLAICSLSSCAIYGTAFECKPGEGAKCSSVSQVNRMINDGMIDGEDVERVNATTPGTRGILESSHALDLPTKEEPKKTTIKPKSAKPRKVDVWLAPTDGTNGKYVQI